MIVSCTFAKERKLARIIAATMNNPPNTTANSLFSFPIFALMKCRKRAFSYIFSLFFPYYCILFIYGVRPMKLCWGRDPRRKHGKKNYDVEAD